MANIEINEATVEALKKFGITTEMLKDSKTKELTEAAAAHFNALNREKIKNEVEQETKVDTEAKIKEAKDTAAVGAHNSSKEKLVKLAKKLGLELPKDEIERADYNKTLSLFETSLATKKDGGDSKDATVAELAQAREQLEKANELIANYKAETEAFPTKLEQHAQKVQKDLKITQMHKELFETFKGKVQSTVFENQTLKEAVLETLGKRLKDKKIVLDIERTSDGKDVLIPKTPQIDKKTGTPMLDQNGSPIYIRAGKDDISNYDAPTLYEEFFKESGLIATQLPGSTNPQNINNQTNNKPQTQQAADQWSKIPLGGI